MSPYNSSMRPHDVVILMKIILKGKQTWFIRNLAEELFISPSEISESLSRSVIAGLIDPSKKNVFSKSLVDFLIHGLKYVFPAIPGSYATGIATAHSAPVMNQFTGSDEKYVWPDMEGPDRGIAIQPLYPGVTKAVKVDVDLYDILALCDVLRIGRVREIKAAEDMLNKVLVAK